jgi:hypothetical protein
VKLLKSLVLKDLEMQAKLGSGPFD